MACDWFATAIRMANENDSEIGVQRQRDAKDDVHDINSHTT